MSSNTEIIRTLYDGFAREDVPAVLAALDPEVRWTEADGSPHGGTYFGPEAVLKNVLMNLQAEWEAFTATPSEFVSERDTVVVCGEYAGTCRATGKRFRAPFAHVWKRRGAMVVRFQQFTDTAVVQSAMV
ncbi:MAG: nuclear transport factor 2 family protein [Gammaproteobacteria bacterium]|nr:nuclear transport factor 2 family protein [Gammaproteobacteria bacterium]NIR82044.1 nuclear transport factor 2 family protein [Gammaproteobacteria bacterium]NIR89272.1 nuclear transport factor 2 family protein [Gammaproteobacteria bacterium]NIU03154.1 nuclear transport factor 2 family protein [Gammaproteobacteria bacterium]NIV50670.1 DUF4440 domain-containing protein [Gammaproteobacteria bacterium]